MSACMKSQQVFSSVQNAALRKPLTIISLRCFISSTASISDFAPKGFMTDRHRSASLMADWAFSCWAMFPAYIPCLKFCLEAVFDRLIHTKIQWLQSVCTV